MPSWMLKVIHTSTTPQPVCTQLFNSTAAMTMEFVARARGEVLRFFNASPDEWAVIFTGNASQALKLVGESYPFGAGDQFLLTFDNHNSVNGIREFARARGATST